MNCLFWSSSSLHWIISLSFLFVFEQWIVLAWIKLSAGDVIVSQQRFQWRIKVAFLWAGL